MHMALYKWSTFTFTFQLDKDKQELDSPVCMSDDFNRAPYTNLLLFI